MCQNLFSTESLKFLFYKSKKCNPVVISQVLFLVTRNIFRLFEVEVKSARNIHIQHQATVLKHYCSVSHHSKISDVFPILQKFTGTYLETNKKNFLQEKYFYNNLTKWSLEWFQISAMNDYWLSFFIISLGNKPTFSLVICDQLLGGLSTKSPHSLAATVFAIGGWNRAWRSSVCVCLCVKACVCVHANWLKESVAMRVAYGKKMRNFQMDSQTCASFSGKVGHEPKNSWFID